LLQRLAHQRELVVLEVAQAAVDQLGRRRRGVRGEIVALGQRNAPATAREITRDAGTIDAAADDEYVNVDHRRRGRRNRRRGWGQGGVSWVRGREPQRIAIFFFRFTRFFRFYYQRFPALVFVYVRLCSRPRFVYSRAHAR